MKKYIIKVTYLTGKYKGESYFMRKGGYITEPNHYHFNSDVYATEAICNRVCGKLFKNNERNYEFESKDREYKKNKGCTLKDWRIYERESYEPYAIEM